MSAPLEISPIASRSAAWRSTRLRGRAGFTLVEIVVSALVILVLVALCLPALLSVRKKMEDAACKNHLKILAGCINAFAYDHNNDLPTGWNPTTRDTWTVLLRPYVKDSVIDNKKQREGPFYCPSTRLDATGIFERDQATWRTDFGVNSNAMSHPPSKMTQFSATTVTLYDGTGVKTGPPAEVKKRARHGGRSNILFLDGHVESYIDFPTADPYWKPR